MTEERYKKAGFAAWPFLAGLIALAVLTAFVGIMANSRALFADALHSCSAVLGSVAFVLGLRAAKLSPNQNHPDKQRRISSISSIMVCVLLIIIGIEIGISAVKTLWNGVNAAPQSYALLVIVVTIMLKEIMYRYTLHLGKIRNSEPQIAKSAELRSGVYSSIAALVGVSGALLGTYLHIPFFYYCDPAAALFVSLLVVKMGYDVILQAAPPTHHHELHPEDTDELINTVQRVKGVITVDDLRAREHGHYVIVEIKISVNPKISVLEGQDIARAAKQQLMKRFSHISEVVVHVHPYDPGYPYKHNVDPEQDHFPTLVH